MNTDPSAPPAAAPAWYDKRSLVWAWLLVFFPVGLYAVWKSRLFDRQRKWVVTGIVVGIVLLFGGSGALDAVVALIFAPLAVYLCWRDPQISRPTTLKFAAGAVVILLLFVAAAGPGG
ncbi:MAG TPA: hypothetical protein ENK41_05105, partial [Rhodobacteraceae bacterium]|nr:hypothetical protein [Paracoccaceae bacterium]